MTTATATMTAESLDLLRLLAVALEKVQRRRRKPAKKGRLHRV